MDKEKLKSLFHFYNPWWSTRTAPRELALEFRRPVLHKLIAYLNLDRILLIKGPRRTGKSTILYQMIEALLNKGVEPKNIFYISLDDIDLRLEISLLIEIYQEATGQVIDRAKAYYFFLDEIHFLDQWSFQIKKYFDRKFPVKFILSGSSASLVKKGSDSLAGRTIEEVMLPFNFREFLSLKLKDHPVLDALNKLEFNLSKTFTSIPSSLLPYKQEIILAFQEYLVKGGSPNIFGISEQLLWQKLLREDIVEKVIYRDLVEYFGIKKPYVLEKLMIYCAQHSSEILNASHISSSLSLSREFVEKYITCLKESYLIFTLMKYSKSLEKRIRSGEKVHLYDSGLISALGRTQPDKNFESVIGRHLYGVPLYYWRENTEVDFVVEDKNKVIPIEVKNKYTLDKADVRGLLQFMEIFKCKKGILISRETLESKSMQHKDISVIPAWLFCLLVRLG